MTAGTYNISNSNTRKCIEIKGSRSTAGYIVIEECLFVQQEHIMSGQFLLMSLPKTLVCQLPKITLDQS
jgi:hypothetical protein